MAIRPEEITAVIKKQIEGFSDSTELKEEGSVLQVGDGIARVYGLENAMSGELLELPNGVMGMVLNLEKENVGCVLFGSDQLVKEGLVKRVDDVDDRRSYLVQLSAKGRKIFATMAAEHEQWLAALFKDLPSSEKEALYGQLGRLRVALRRPEA